MTPSALCVEIERHEKYLACIYAGVAKLGARALKKREEYVMHLKAQLKEITHEPEFEEQISDKDLLLSLGLDLI